MYKQVSIKLPFDIFEDIQDEAKKNHISISDVIRNRLYAKSRFTYQHIQEPQFKNSDEEITKPKSFPSSDSDFTTFETLLLLREFLFERNGQILKKVDEKLDTQFGKDRKKMR
jgi:hypothetical protein